MSTVIHGCDAYHPIVMEAQAVIESDVQLAAQLTQMFVEAGHDPLSADAIDFPVMYRWLDSILTMSPSTDNAMIIPHTFYKFAVTEAGSALMADARINDWMRRWLNHWKEFLDSPASTSQLASWLDSMDLTDFVVPDAGFSSFNAFFCREVRAGARPIAAAEDAALITSPVDGTVDFVVRALSVDEAEQRFVVKGVELNVRELLGDDADKARRYDGGTLILLSLYPRDYHHYHAWCNGGVVRGMRQLGGYYFSFGNAQLVSNCSWSDVPACHAYWSHVNRRAIVDVQCERGARKAFESTMVVVGLGHVSSLNFVVAEGDELRKGDKIGHFAFGGSTLSLLFPSGTVQEVLAEVGQEMRLGQPLARIAMTDHEAL